MKKPRVEQTKQSPYLYLLAALLGIIIFVIAAIGARHGQMQGWEQRLFYDIFDWPSSLRWLFLGITQGGSSWAIIAATLVSYLEGYRHLAWRFLLSGMGAYVLVEVAKHIINRPRPYVLLNGIHERELFVQGKGFPSGHTATATALALTLLVHLPKKWRWLPVLWILSVGLSRIYLGVHAPLDIVGGFAIGLTVAATLHFVVNTDHKFKRTKAR